MQGSVCRLNFKTALDTEALSCSGWRQNDEQLALQQNTRPIQRQITHRGRCARAIHNEWTSKRDKKQSEHWTLDFKRWPWHPVKINSRSQWAFTCAAQSKSNTDFYGLVFQRPWITYHCQVEGQIKQSLQQRTRSYSGHWNTTVTIRRKWDPSC